MHGIGPVGPVSTAAARGYDDSMDEVARRYLLLGLRLARHRPDLVGAFYGPPELAEAVAGEEPALAAELHTEAMTLAGMASELPQETPDGGRGSAWLALPPHGESAAE